MAGAVEDIHSGFSLSSTGKWMPRMAALLESLNGCYSARTPAKLAMAGRMAGLLEPACAWDLHVHACMRDSRIDEHAAMQNASFLPSLA